MMAKSIKQLRDEREKLNLQIEKLRLRARKMSRQIADMETKEAAGKPPPDPAKTIRHSQVR